MVSLLVRHRPALRVIYRRAYLERESGAGAPVTIAIKGQAPLIAGGLYLDLGLHYVRDQLVSTGDPRALGPADALEAFLTHQSTFQVRPPLAISPLAAAIVELGEPSTEHGGQAERNRR